MALTGDERSAAEATFKRLNLIFRDDNIDEFALTADPTDELYHQTGKLALSTRVIPSLSRFCHYLLAPVAARCFSSESAGNAERMLVAQLCRAILLMSANNYTAWNMRKRLIEAGSLDPQADLDFNYLVLAFHTKADHGWAHRKWVLGLMRSRSVTVDVERELALCNRVAVVRRRNYYAWAHRCWLLPWVSDDLLFKDLEYTHCFHHANIGDWSCMCYRLSVFARLLANEATRSRVRALVEAEVVFLEEQCSLHSYIPELRKFEKQCTALIVNLPAVDEPSTPTPTDTAKASE